LSIGLIVAGVVGMNLQMEHEVSNNYFLVAGCLLAPLTVALVALVLLMRRRETRTQSGK